MEPRKKRDGEGQPGKKGGKRNRWLSKKYLSVGGEEKYKGGKKKTIYGCMGGRGEGEDPNL